jgi:hypothetical protein
MVTDQSDRQGAPGELEAVRTLLNSWLIPNDTRVPTDRFDEYARQHNLRGPNARTLRQLRDDLRAAVEGGALDERIDLWIEQLRVRPAVRDGHLRFEHEGHHAGDILAIVLTTMIDGRWARLKACPDCRWVFYDHTRNASKRWCLMNAGGPQGRACGTIAKVRRHRQRAREPESGEVDKGTTPPRRA